MLKYFKEKNLVYYPETTPSDWKKAIEISCKKLIEQKLITEKYTEEIISSVIENGPYIVIMPNIALPHAAGNNDSVNKSAISFTKFREPVKFIDNNGEEKEARLFFTLAAKNSDEHLKNIVRLTELLSNERLVEELLQTSSVEEYNSLAEKENK